MEPILYAGKKMRYIRTIDNIDEAQAEIDYFRRYGYQSCCTHNCNDHHLFVEEKYFERR